ncbi:MAG: DMT family transporter [Flammeovirgaceae bacterium]
MMSAVIRYVPHIPPIELVLFRAIFTLIFSYITLIIKKIPVWGNNPKPLILRGAFGTAALLLQFYVVQSIPLATAKVLFYLTPVFGAFLAVYWLKEKVYKMQWLFFLISFLGTAIMKGFDDRIPLMPLLAGVTSAVFSAGVITTISSMRNQENSHVIVFYFPLVAFPFALIGSLFFWVTPSWTDLGWLFLMGVCTQLGQITMTKAYQSDDSNKIAAASYIELIYVLVIGWLLFDETFDWKVLMGMGLVVLGVVLNLTYKRVRPFLYDKILRKRILDV